jgi:heme exporter protein B
MVVKQKPVFLILMKRELLLYFRAPTLLINPLLFFLSVLIIFPLASIMPIQELNLNAPAMIWLACLLASLLSLDAIWRDDQAQGILTQLLLSPTPFYYTVICKCVSHWLITGLPIMLLTPIVALLYTLPFTTISIILITLLIGTPLISCLGVMIAAVTMTTKQNHIMLPMLLLPLLIPTLIFATLIINHAGQGFVVAHEIILFLALLILTITLAPLATVGILKLTVE